MVQGEQPPLEDWSLTGMTIQQCTFKPKQWNPAIILHLIQRQILLHIFEYNYCGGDPPLVASETIAKVLKMARSA